FTWVGFSSIVFALARLRWASEARCLHCVIESRHCCGAARRQSVSATTRNPFLIVHFFASSVRAVRRAQLPLRGDAACLRASVARPTERIRILAIAVAMIWMLATGP